MNVKVLGCVVFLALVRVAHAGGEESGVWNFKREFLPVLVDSVPRTLKTQDPATGRFGTGVWIAGDQVVIFPLAVAWALKDPGNPWYHDPKLLEAIMKGGDALVQAQDARGQWVFRKKDNSTWGSHYNPWVYSRWIRAYGLIGDAMPPDRKAVWVKGLELGFSGIEQHELNRVHNIPAHQAMGLYFAGKALNHPEWSVRAGDFLARVAAAQDTNGFWSEHVGPVVLYNGVYVDALGTYYGVSHDERVFQALERAARFHANFTYPDGTAVETVDERTPYSKSCRMPSVGFSFTPEGRGYLQQQWKHLNESGARGEVDALASLLLYGEEGPVAQPPGASREKLYLTADGKASVVRQGSWCAALSAYACPVFPSRWIQDRQNLISLFHERCGLLLGGGNTKLQPLWSTFTVGDTSRLKHRPGDEQPDFKQPAGLIHVPSKAALDRGGRSLALEYGDVTCGVTLDLPADDTARLTYIARTTAKSAPVEAHLTFMPSMGKSWLTASGKTGAVGAKPFKLSALEAGGWFEHNGWRVELPEQSSITWPVLPHNPYRKDGRAEPAEGRIVLTVPFSKSVVTQSVVIRIPGPR